MSRRTALAAAATLMFLTTLQAGRAAEPFDWSTFSDGPDSPVSNYRAEMENLQAWGADGNALVLGSPTAGLMLLGPFDNGTYPCTPGQPSFRFIQRRPGTAAKGPVEFRSLGAPLEQPCSAVEVEKTITDRDGVMVGIKRHTVVSAPVPNAGPFRTEWVAAADYCSQVAWGGWSDWRLVSKDQLERIAGSDQSLDTSDLRRGIGHNIHASLSGIALPGQDQDPDVPGMQVAISPDAKMIPDVYGGAAHFGSSWSGESCFWTSTPNTTCASDPYRRGPSGYAECHAGGLEAYGMEYRWAYFPSINRFVGLTYAQSKCAPLCARSFPQ